MVRLLIIVLTFIYFSYSQQLAQIINLALENNPTLKSYENLIRSKELRSEYKLSLPNPVVGFALQSVELEYPFPRASNPMSGLALFISQKYVLGEKRKKDSQIAEKWKEKIKKDKELFERRLIRRIKENYFDFQYSFLLEDLSKSIKREIEDLLDVSEEHYIYDRTNLSDLIFLKVELKKIEESIVFSRRLREKSLANIKALVGVDIEVEREDLPLLKFPETFNPSKSIFVRVIEKEIEVLKAEEDRLKVEHLPDIYLTGAYLVRPDIPDLITLKAGFTIPLWYEKKEKLMVMEKREDIRAKISYMEGIKLEVEGEYEALKAIYLSLREMYDLVRKEIEEKKKEIESLNVAFIYEKEDFRELLRAYRELWKLKLREIKLLLDISKVVVKAEELL